MWTQGGRLEESAGSPEYAILPRLWAEDKVTFEDMARSDVQSTPKCSKVRGTMRQETSTTSWIDTRRNDKAAGPKFPRPSMPFGPRAPERVSKRAVLAATLR
jgi:hypothetical protein